MTRALATTADSGLRRAPAPLCADSERVRGNRLRGKRVVIAVPSFGFGGAERQALLLARELAHREGALVRIVSISPPGIPLELTESCDREGVAWTRFTFTHTYGQRLLQLWDLMRFTAWLRRERPDILLPYCMFPNIVCALTWQAGGAGLCVWNQRDEGRSRVMRVVERLAVSRVRCFISNSLHGAAFVQGELNVPRSRVHVVHNGIELAEPGRRPADWRRTLALPDQAFVGCMVANLHSYKDHETLIEAWRRVATHLEQRGREAHLLLAGAPGNRETAIKEQIRRLGLTARVHVLGVVADVSGLLGAIDVAVFSSMNEGLPNAVLEAMAAGVPVVATDYPGIREAVGSGGETFLAQPRNAADLARKIIQLADDESLRARLGVEGHARARGEFSVRRMADATTDILIREMERMKA